MIRHTIREWEKIKGVKILDPDGFDRNDVTLMERLFTEAEFDVGMINSTVSMPPIDTHTEPADLHSELDHLLPPLIFGSDYRNLNADHTCKYDEVLEAVQRYAKRYALSVGLETIGENTIDVGYGVAWERNQLRNEQRRTLTERMEGNK